MKKDFLFLKRCRWLPLMLFALLTGVSPAWAEAVTLPYSYGFEDYNLATDGWTKFFGTSLTSNNNGCAIVGDAKKTGSYGFRFSSYSTQGVNAQYLISPELPTDNGGVTVSFAYKSSNSNYEEVFKVGYSTTGTDVANFSWGNEVSYKGDWTTYETTFPAGTKYVAVYYYSNYEYYLYVDDFRFEAVEVFDGPALKVFDGDNVLTSGDSYSFGLANAGAEKTFTLKNPGTEAVTVNVAATNGFGVNPANATIAAGGEQTLTVTMASATATGEVTITPTASGVAPVTINVSGSVKDPNKIFIDFSDSPLPATWTLDNGWSVSGGVATINYASYSGGYVGSYIRSGAISVDEGGENLLFRYARNYNYESSDLKVYWATTGNGSDADWTEATGTTPEFEYNVWKDASYAIPATAKYIAIYGLYVNVDDIYGLNNPSGVLFAINTDGTTTQDLGAVYAGGVAEKKFTITNSGNAALPVTFTDAADFYVAKTVSFTKPNSWTGDKLYLYAWDGSGALTAGWPGDEVTEAAQNDMGEWVYTARLPKGATGIKFSDNASHETGDISTTEFKDIIGLWLDNATVKTWKNVDFSVPANGSADFYVRMNTATAGAKNGNIALAFDALNATEFTIPVSGYVFDETKMIVDFSGNALPEGWTNATNGGAAWTFADGVAYGQYANYTNAKMTSPLLTVAEGESLVFQTKGNMSYADMKVNVYDRAGSKVKTVDFSTEARAAYSAGAYTLVTLSGLEAGDYRLEFEAYNSYIDNINGFTVNQNDPKLGIYTDADCTVAATTTVTKDFGFVTEAPEAATYYIKNDGTGTLTLSKTVADGFTATLDKTALGAGDKATLTISLPVASNGGYHKGNVVVTAADELGTFTVALSGVVVEEGKLNLNFATDNIPATWTPGDWSKSRSGYMEAGYSSTTMQTSTLVAKANETLAVEAKQTYTGSYTFGVKYRKVGADEWTDLIPAQNIGTDWTVIGATIAEAGNYELQFTGNYTQIRRIYGLEKPEAPEMVVYDGEAVAAATYSFGKVTDEADAEHTFTVKNEGLATMTGLTATLSGDNADHYRVVVSAESVEAGQSATVTVKQLKDNLGAHSAVLTISATGLDSKEIALSGTTVDHTALDIDFDASNEWPAEILKHGDSWTVYNYNGSGEARQDSYQQATDLVLAPLTISSEEDKLTFDVAYYNYSSYREFTVSYSTDGGATWTPYNWGTEESPVTDLKESIGYNYAKQTITGIPAGTVVFKFTGKSIKLDNISGDMKVATAPMVDFATVEDNINGKNLSADATATYTLQNFGNADYVATVAATGVTVAATGDDVTFDTNTLTVPAGKTATITATMAFAAPYGEKTGKLEITSESWVGDITVNYTAETIDPTSFLVDFADNQKPAGWYSEAASSVYGGWVFTNGDARINASSAKPMITEKIGAESGKNVISFDAKVASGSDEQTLSVYTSTDRQTWSEAQTFDLTSTEQNFKLTALADGEYYVKFEARNAIVDNIKGVKKLDAPAHDLYEISTTMAASGTPGASYTATVTAVSLRADETVVAELWVEKGGNGTKVASLENQAMTTGTSKTFTLTGNLPTEEGSYEAWITVKNTDNSAYFNTERIAFTLEHTTMMAVSDLTAVATSVQADDNNEFTADFTVTLKNTGSKTLAASEVSVSITDDHTAEANVYTTKTAAQYVYVYPGAYTADNAVIALWNWSNSEDGEWVATTDMGSGLYVAELKEGKTNFSVVRINPTGEGADNWANKWNQSVDLSTAAGNVFTFNGWDDKDGDNHRFAASAFTLAAGETVVLPVSVTADAGDGGTFSFNAKENVTNTFYHNNYNVSVSVTAAPVLTLSETSNSFSLTEGDRYYRVTLNRSFIEGWNTLVLPFDFAAADFVGATFYEFSANNNGELTFRKVTAETLTAGTPYLVSLPAAVTEPMVFSKVQIAAVDAGDVEHDNAHFIGSYVNGFDMEGKYGVAPTGTVQKGAAGSTMKAFRAYITMPEGQQARIALFDETTGIRRVLTSKEVENLNIYNLGGQRVDEHTKGIVIVNGKKQVVK